MKRLLLLLCPFLLAIAAPVQGQLLILEKSDLLPITSSSASMMKRVFTEKFAAIEGVVWSPGGTLLAVLTPEGVWLYSYFEAPRFLPNASGTLDRAEFSVTGDRLNVELRDFAVGDQRTQKIEIWDMRTGASLGVRDVDASADSSLTGRRVSMTTSMRSSDTRLLAVSPDRAQLVALSGSSMHVWDANRRVARYSVDGHTSEIQAAAFSPDNTLVVSGSADGMIIVRDALTGELLEDFTTDPVISLAFAPDGGLLAVATQGGSVLLWNTRTWELSHTLEALGSVTGIAFSPDGTRLAVGGETLSIWAIKHV
jgi:WD40 repeat protein